MLKELGANKIDSLRWWAPPATTVFLVPCCSGASDLGGLGLENTLLVLVRFGDAVTGDDEETGCFGNLVFVFGWATTELSTVLGFSPAIVVLSVGEVRGDEIGGKVTVGRGANALGRATLLVFSPGGDRRGLLGADLLDVGGIALLGTLMGGRCSVFGSVGDDLVDVLSGGRGAPLPTLLVAGGLGCCDLFV